MTVVGGALVLGIVFAMVLAERRRTELDVLDLSAELRSWAHLNGWAVTDTLPAVLTTGAIDEVNLEEHRHLTLTGKLEGRAAAMTWCTWSDGEATHRYAALLAELAVSPLAMRIRQRYGTGTWRRDKLKVLEGDLSAPAREALDRLRSAIGWHDEFVRVQGRVLRVVIGGWPRSAAVDAALRATAAVATTLSQPDSQNRPSSLT